MIVSRRLDEVATIIMGQAPPGEAYNFEGKGWPLIAGASDFDGVNPSSKKHTTEASKISKPGDIILGIRATIGAKVLADDNYCLGRGVAAIRASDFLDTRFLWYWLGHIAPELAAKGRGATFKQVNRQDIGEMLIELPPFADQSRTACVLDKVDGLRTNRLVSLAMIDSLSQSIFIDMFGDPARNSMNWPLYPLGELAVRFSDGPFGSNLKSSHYTRQGIRVIRLQNIGVGEFIDDDEAYISEDHFSSLRKHTCLPGDVLIGTLGDPNLRACIQPDWLDRALNKADCVQMRVAEEKANSRFICALLNQPSIEDKARSLMQGQTRIRISMGRLRTLMVPTPPLGLQKEFDRRLAAVDKLKLEYRANLDTLEELFASLQYRVFSGELSGLQAN